MRNKFLLLICLLVILACAASAQYKDPELAMANMVPGFNGGHLGGIVSAIPKGGQAEFQFSGLSEENGLIARDKAEAYLYKVWAKIVPWTYKLTEARQTEDQYVATGDWTTKRGKFHLYVTLRKKDGLWELVSVRSSD